MKLEFTTEQVDKISKTIDAGLKNTHIGGLNVMEGAIIFAQGVAQAQQQQEQNEQKISPMRPAADSASQLG